MEYQFIKQRRQFACKFGKIIFQSSTTLSWLAFAGATCKSSYPRRTTRPRHSTSAAKCQTGINSIFTFSNFYIYGVSWELSCKLIRIIRYFKIKKKNYFVSKVRDYELSQTKGKKKQYKTTIKKKLHRLSISIQKHLHWSLLSFHASISP